MLSDIVCFGPNSAKFACRRCKEIRNALRKNCSMFTEDRNCVYQYRTEASFKTVIVGRILELANIKKSISDSAIEIWQSYPSTKPYQASYGQCRLYTWICYEADELNRKELELYMHEQFVVTNCIVSDETFFPTIDSKFSVREYV